MLLDAHNWTFDYFQIGFAFVVFFPAVWPLEDPASKRTLRANLMARHVAAGARVEVDRSGGLEVGLNENLSQTDARSELRCDQEVVFTDHPQAGQMG